MKNFVFILGVVLSLYACSNEDAPKDTETNKYYADYVAIYAAYDSVGNEGTLKALDEYLLEFPERHEAYVFKAYILAKMGKMDEANSYFEKARSMDRLAIESYEYQSAFMLYDTNQLDATAKLIEDGLAVDDSSAHLLNNRAWVHLLEGEYEMSLNDVEEGISVNPKTKNLYRTGFVTATLMEEDSLANYYAEKLITLEIDNPDSVRSTLNNEGLFAVLKSLF